MNNTLLSRRLEGIAGGTLVLGIDLLPSEQTPKASADFAPVHIVTVL